MNEFTLIGEIEEKNPLTYLITVSNLLNNANFKSKDTIFRLIYNKVDCEYEFAECHEVSDRIELLNFSNGIVGEIKSIGKWDGWFCSFNREDICFDVGFGKSDKNVCNCYIKLAVRYLIILLQTDNTNHLYRLLAKILKVGKSRIGIMDVGFEIPSLTESRILEGLLDSPVNPGYPVSVGFIVPEILDSCLDKQNIQLHFSSRLLPEKYWALEERDYLEVYSQLTP
ncbi:MAG: hypothetical protein CVV06_08310 [Gammaproteobacteria bacterium HGW-Gammaproteobacteria-10]|nr:MAG: hypothetical protein CVV06_08310 [Gammaproteobacteria bacterium HGW-Gammaproteobacteria-10]